MPDKKYIQQQNIVYAWTAADKAAQIQFIIHMLNNFKRSKRSWRCHMIWVAIHQLILLRNNYLKDCDRARYDIALIELSEKTGVNLRSDTA